MRQAMMVWTAMIGAMALAAPAWAAGPDDGDAAVAGVASALVAAVPVVPALDRLDLSISKPIGQDPFGTLKGAIRHRFASSMIDLYPKSGAGFHLSFGTRFLTKRNFARDAMELTGGLLYSPRLPRGAVGLRGGFKRYTPAATMGYTVLANRSLLIGVEGGTLFGRAISPMPRGFRTSGEGHRNQLNPVLNLTVAYAF